MIKELVEIRSILKRRKSKNIKIAECNPLNNEKIPTELRELVINLIK